jgi:hypothetical protein
MVTVVISLILSVLAGLHFLIGVDRWYPNYIKQARLAFLLTAILPAIFFFIELVTNGFAHPAYFITHLIAICFVLGTRVGVGVYVGLNKK